MTSPSSVYWVEFIFHLSLHHIFGLCVPMHIATQRSETIRIYFVMHDKANLCETQIECVIFHLADKKKISFYRHKYH